MSLLSDNITKLAKSIELQRLIEAKKKSDNKEYQSKNKIIQDLLAKHPRDFKIDSLLDKNYVGLTHKPTGFKIHAPRTLIPVGIEYNIKKAEQERVRVVVPYEGKYLLERLNNPAWPKNFGKRRFIGGGIEQGETPEQAAARELFEELGQRLDPKDFRPLGRDPEAGHHYLELAQHNLNPGVFKASKGSDPFITLEHGLPEGDDYLGPVLKNLVR
jgi:8-oxo-dGTP pyrophosphatase MutT (NUDIX family)